MSPNVDIDDETFRDGNDISGPSRTPLRSVLRDGMRAWHRSLIGEPDATQLGIPFRKRFADRDADILLRQVSATGFCLEESFRFEHAGQPPVVVERGDATDLASVPTFLTWLVPRYGRHTLPALLHDHLVEPGMDPDLREQADTTFRDSMGDAKVPLVRRWSMWAAVSLATHSTRGLASKVFAIAWAIAYAVAGLDLLKLLLRWHPVPLPNAAGIALILLSPIVLSVLWGRRYLVGLIAAYNLLVLAAPIVAVGITLLLYMAAEGVGQTCLHVLRRRHPDLQVNPVRLSRL